MYSIGAFWMLFQQVTIGFLYKKQLLYLFVIFSISGCNSFLPIQSRKSKNWNHPNSNFYLQTASQHIKDMSLFPINNFRFRLSELKSSKAIVIVMRDSNCPINKEYGLYFSEMERKYKPLGVKFIYNYVGTHNSERSAYSDLKKFHFSGDYLIDSDFEMAKRLDVQTTGDVVILTPDLQVIYKGPISDKFLSTDKKRTVRYSGKTGHFLQNVLDDLLEDIPVTLKKLSSSGCAVLFPKIKKTVFFKDMIPTIKNKCLNCHSQNLTLVDLSSYESIYGRRAMIKYLIKNNLMPPWFIDRRTGPWKNNFSLTVFEKEMFLQWLDSGLPYKAKNKLVADKTKNCSIEKPDYIARPGKPVKIPETGYLPYMDFFREQDFNEDKWIKGYEFVTEQKIVHHFSIFIFDRTKFAHLKGRYRWEDMFKCLRRGSNMCVPTKHNIIAWTIGRKKSDCFSERMGIKVPKKALFLVQIHYETIGEKVTDHYSKLKLEFHSKPPKYQKVTMALLDDKINIPAHNPNYLNEMRYKIKRTMRLDSVSSHMHLRGKASAISIVTSKDVEEKIIRWDPYYYNFQGFYTFQKPLTVRKGSTIICRNWFDNSAGNPVNPNPQTNVQWGFSSKKEMSACLFHWLIPISQDPYREGFF